MQLIHQDGLGKAGLRQTGLRQTGLRRIGSILLTLMMGLAIGLGNLGFAPLPAAAGPIDPFVLRFLDAKEPVPLMKNDQGETQTFSALDLTAGKRLFEDNCKNCHVGGTTLPNPTVPLSLEALHGATPPRDTIESLVAYIREPLSYDGTEEAYLCRQVPQSWMDQAQVKNLAAFIVRSAQKAPGWGSTSF